jgi:hypothetical protein
MDAVRKLAAKRRLDRAKVELTRAADALERFNREQRGDLRPITPDTAAEEEPATVSVSSFLLLPPAPLPPPIPGPAGTPLPVPVLLNLTHARSLWRQPVLC